MLTRLSLLASLAAGALGCSTGSGGHIGDAGPDTPEVGPCRLANDAGKGPTTDGLLTTLEVTGSGKGTLTLIPAFSPGISDYYVRCSAGTNALMVSATASTGASVSLAIETPASPKGTLEPKGSAAATQTATLSLVENQAIVATALRGSASQEYWVRCLPHDMSPMTWSVHADCARTPGYYLVGNEAPPTGGVAYAMVLDTNGVPVWYYPISSTSGVYDVDYIVDGSISFIAWPMTPGFEFHRLTPPATTVIAPTGEWLNPHEVRALANGHYLMFTTTPETGVDLTGFNVALSDGGIQHYGPNSNMLPCTIVEVDPKGTVLWKWIGSDHIDPVKDNELAELLGAGGGLVPDPYHCNSIDVDPANGNLLVSSREENSLFYIDRGTGKILWKLGGSPLTKDHAQYIPVSNADAFRLQHDARLLPGWSSTCGGQITLFDDEWAALGIPARAVVYDVILGGTKPGGQTCGTVGATATWQFRGTKTSFGMGSFRITSDGSRIIGWGHGGAPGLIFTEVDAEGRDLLDLYYDDGSASYRALKLPTSALDIASLRSNAGLIKP